MRLITLAGTYPETALVRTVVGSMRHVRSQVDALLKPGDLLICPTLQDLDTAHNGGKTIKELDLSAHHRHTACLVAMSAEVWMPYSGSITSEMHGALLACNTPLVLLNCGHGVWETKPSSSDGMVSTYQIQAARGGVFLQCPGRPRVSAGVLCNPPEVGGTYVNTKHGHRVTVMAIADIAETLKPSNMHKATVVVMAGSHLLTYSMLEFITKHCTE